MKKLFCTLVLLAALTPFPATAATIQVPQDRPTIQAAIDAAGNGDVIMLAAGTYTGKGNYNLKTQGKELTIKSVSGPAACLIDCQGQGQGFNIRFGLVTLEGLSIKNGFSGSGGGGIYAEKAELRITDCIFAGNRAAFDGGAVLVTQRRAVFTNCIFTNNHAFLAGGAISLTYAAFSFTNCTFTGNSAGQGGAVVAPVDNRDWPTNCNFINCTFAGNSATQKGGAISCFILYPRDMMTLKNCILWGNSAPQGAQVYEDPKKPLTIAWCDIQGGRPGEGNLDSDPLFVDPAGHDLHLMENSPAIDAGTAAGAPAFDLDGNPRPNGAGIDMGAYEYRPSTPPADTPPVINSFTAAPDHGPIPLQVSFVCLATDPDGGSIVEYRWDFDNDGTPEQTTTVNTASYTYPGTGPHTAVCTVVDDEGTAATSTGLVITVEPPVPPYEEGEYNYYVPYFSAAGNFWTGLGIANASSDQETSLQATVYNQAGRRVKTETRIIAARGQAAFQVGKGLQTPGWVRVNSHQPLYGLAFVGGAGPHLMMADVPFIEQNGLSPCLVIPHIAQTEAWDTSIFICNPNPDRVTVTISFINEQGELRGSKKYPIRKMGSGAFPLATVFPGRKLDGRIEISATGKVAAFALYTDLKSGGYNYAGIDARECGK